MTNPIHDITHDVDCILLVGSNPEEAHPVVGMQIREAVKNGTRLIVVDPREIGLAKKADIHLKLRPGTNVAFANGMMNVMIEEDLVDHDYINENTEGSGKNVRKGRKGTYYLLPWSDRAFNGNRGCNVHVGYGGFVR